MGWCRGSLGGKKLRCCGVRPHLNPLPGGEEVASLPRFWILAPYRGSGCAFDGKTKWGRCVDVGGGIAVGVLSRNVSAWIPAPYRGTGQALRWNDEMSGESLSRIGVREVLPCQYEAGPGLESIRSWIRV